MRKSQINKCQKIAEFYGPHSQEAQMASELFELGQVITRRQDQRRQDWKDDLLDELADNTIMIRQVCILHGITDEDLDRKIDEKLDRQLDRMKNGE